jgi:hypothetical protein
MCLQMSPTDLPSQSHLAGSQSPPLKAQGRSGTSSLEPLAAEGALDVMVISLQCTVAAWKAIHAARSGEVFPVTGQSDPEYPKTIPARESDLALARSHARATSDLGTR